MNGYINNSTDVKRIVVENPEWTMEDNSTLTEKLMEQFPNKAIITIPEESYPEKVTVIEIEGKCRLQITLNVYVKNFGSISKRIYLLGHFLFF